MKTADPRRATFFQRLLLVVVSPLVFLALLEGGIRISGLPTDVARNKNFKVAVPVWLLADPGWVRGQQQRIEQNGAVRAEDVDWFANFEETRYIGLKLKPNLDVRVVNPFNDIEVSKGTTFRIVSNDVGFRGRPYPAKSPVVLRIVTIGDSSTFGWGVDPEFTYQELLADRLKLNGRRADVFNFGIPGMTSRHGLAVLEHYGLRHEPDIVVASFGANDARFVPVTADEELAADEILDRGGPVDAAEVPHVPVDAAADLQLLRPVLGARRQEGPGTHPSAPESRVTRELRQEPADDTRDGYRPRGEDSVSLGVFPPDYVDAMRKTSQALNVPMVDVGQIFYDKIDGIVAGQIYPAEAQYYRELYGMEALEAFWRYWVTTDGCHPNRVGQSLIADALADAVRSTFGQ